MNRLSGDQVRPGYADRAAHDAAASGTRRPLTIMFHSGPIRPGTRGGQGDFTWAEVSADKDREVREKQCPRGSCYRD